ncbi:hypothetical protein [Plasticicumulans sp.]|uniref:phage major capsid protein n=1 Tax=Plasticicumulans sp. TaxID=2307179 RepID=UPI0032206F83
MPATIPATGLHGARLREAQTSELGDLACLIRDSLIARLAVGWVDLTALYPDRAVVRRDGRLLAYPYTLGADNVVTWGEPVEVVVDHAPTAVREAADSTGRRWLVRAIDTGASRNGRDYPAAVLREAVPLFEGARVLVKSDAEHLAGAGKDVRNLVGKLRQARFVEAAGRDPGGITAELVIVDAGLAERMREAADLEALDLFQFSIDADGQVNKTTGRVESISRVRSLDLIVEAAAGGRVLTLIEAQQEQSDMALRERMIEAIKARCPALLLGLDVNDDEKLAEAYAEALRIEAAGKPAAVEAGAADNPLLMRLLRSDARALIEASALPRPSKDRLITGLVDRSAAALEDAPIREAIQREADYLQQIAPSGLPDLGWASGAATETRSRYEQIRESLDGFFAAQPGAPRSIRELYGEITGDRRCTGRVDACDPRRLREAAGPQALREAIDTTAFANVLGEALQRRMVADYNRPSQYDVWRDLAGTPVPLTDFRTNERVRFGGYGDLPHVAEKGAYAALSSPSDEKATYAAGKRGGIETVSLEAIANDDVGAVRQIPLRMSGAAKRTLAKFVMDLLRTNPTIYDSVALFHATHNNLGTSGLGAASWSAARLAMLHQTEPGSSDRLGIAPATLFVPSDLEETANNLFVVQTEQEQQFRQRTAPKVRSVWYWTDANDWVAAADPLDLPSVEVGFLNGNEEPELFTQDLPTVGSLFSNDQITYKIRHIYGAAILNFRGLYKAVVP